MNRTTSYGRSSNRAHISALLVACGAVALLAGCASQPAAVVQPSIALTSNELVGKWGLASYRDAKDAARTQAEASRACSNPYVITPGAGGGVMMHLADQAQPTEVVLKTASDGRLYIGPAGPAGGKLDRQVVSYADGVMVTSWVNPDAATRYGTMMFVRCKA
jgi:hypothetical protein